MDLNLNSDSICLRDVQVTFQRIKHWLLFILKALFIKLLCWKLKGEAGKKINQTTLALTSLITKNQGISTIQERFSILYNFTEA